MDEQKIKELQQAVKGTIARPGEEAYVKASKMLFHTVEPGVVVRPVSSADVAATIGFARKHDLPLAIRSGGHHNVASRLPAGMVLIDLSGLAAIAVLDAEQGTVRVGAGALWHEVASALEPHGLGISSGDTRTVGVGGLTTGAGLGWMVRKYGPVVDNILSAEVVTADGSILQASPDENPDLFWAIRGGGSNFGVVTQFVFRAHKVQGIFDGLITFPLQDTGKVLKGWRDAMRQAPAELTTMFMTIPSFGAAPPMIMIRGCFESTDKAAADRAFAPFLKLGKPTNQKITEKPYKDMLEDAAMPPNTRVVNHNAFLQELTDEVIDVIDKLCQGTVPILQIRHIAGEMNKTAPDATAFSHRDSEVLILHPVFVPPTASKQDIETALGSWRQLEPFSQGCYLNLMSEDTGTELAQAFPPATLKRLQKIKAQYDPDNVFHTNYNIPPLASDSQS